MGRGGGGGRSGREMGWPLGDPGRPLCAGWQCRENRRVRRRRGGEPGVPGGGDGMVSEETRERHLGMPREGVGRRDREGTEPPWGALQSR